MADYLRRFRFKYWTFRGYSGSHFVRPGWFPGSIMPKVFETENALGVVPNPATNPDGRPFVIDAFGGYAGSFGGDTGIKDVTVYPTEDAFFHRFPWFQDRDSWNPKPPAPPQTPPSGVKGIGNKIFY